MKPAHYLRTYLALLALLGATYALARIDLGRLGTPVALAIATAKAGLVALFFMHLRDSRGLIRAAAGIGVFWLAILFTLTLSDYRGRGDLPLPGHWPQALSGR